MKLHWLCSIGGQNIVYWYDPRYQWVVARHDKDGNQIGDAEYVGHKSALTDGLNRMVAIAIKEVNDNVS